MITVAINPWTCHRRSRRRGFSLAELMISIGILAVGMSILAALFPAAIAMNRRSSRTVLGSIICENGVSLMRSAFGSGAVDKPDRTLPTLVPLADDKTATYFTPAMCRFPQGDPDSDYGFMMLYRHLDADDDETTEEGRQVVTVAYHRRKGQEYPRPKVHFKLLLRVALPLNKSTSIVLNNTDGHFRMGSPVISQVKGEFVIAEQVFRANYGATEGDASRYLTSAKLDRTVTEEFFRSPIDNIIYPLAWVVLEGEADSAQREARFSPAMSTLVTRLSPDWR